MYWLQFSVSAVVIVIAGIRLTHFADQLSAKLNLGKVWIGIVLLGLVTSLPEAVTSLIAVITLKADDLALGNLVGSNNFNPLLIIVLDVMYRRGSVTNAIEATKSHLYSSFFAVALTSIIILEIFLNFYIPIERFSVGYISIGTILVILIYFLGMKYLSTLGSAPEDEETSQMRKGEGSSLKSIWLNVIVCAFFIVVGAIWLTQSADVIADKTGLGRTFIGSILLAFVTSLPEMVVTISALKMGALDLAIGNIFGSNMTNMFIVSVCSVFHPSSPFLGGVSIKHVFTANLSILLTLILIRGIHLKNKRSFYGIGWDSLLIFIFFILGMGFLYFWRMKEMSAYAHL